MKLDFDYQCDVPWEDMKGGDRRRHCEKCDKHVHHISGMTEKQARKFLEDHDYNVCADYFRDGDGNIVFKPEEKRLRMQLDGAKQLLAAAAAVIPLALAAVFITDDDPAPAATITATVAPGPPTPISLNTETPTVHVPMAIPNLPPPNPPPVDFQPPEQLTPPTPETEPPVQQAPPAHQVNPPITKKPVPQPHPDRVRGRIARPEHLIDVEHNLMGSSRL